MSLAAQAVAIQARPSQVRNLCVLAHVDHGKTTLSDFLCSSNGVISSKLAGSARYLDSRADEQERQITMKSSSICLVYQDKDLCEERGEELLAGGEDEAAARRQAVRESFFVVNLIDSPGHVDFSSEVSNAVRCTDGALVLVDVVDGACAQTFAVLQQAWAEGVRPCLVFNKLDRLITELRLTPAEAYTHIVHLLETVNAFASSFHVGDRMEAAEDAAVDIDDDEGLFFSPSAGNVIFASAIDNWAFGLPQFARLYEKKLGMRRKALMRALWGDYYYHPKTRSVSRKPTRAGKNMFVQFILEQVWAVYQRVLEEENSQLMHKIIDSLGVKVPLRELNTPDWRARLRAIFGRWLPVAPAVLGMVVRQLPSPAEAAAARLAKFWTGAAGAGPTADAALRCDPQGPLVLFVAKMVFAGDAMERSRNPVAQRKFVRRAYVRGRHAGGAPAEGDDDDGGDGDGDGDGDEAKDGDEAREDPQAGFLAFARVFGGTLDTRPGSEQELHVFGPKYDPARPGEHHAVVRASELRAYTLMGRELEPVERVPAGSVCGIGGLGGVVLNTATVSTDAACLPFGAMRFQSAPIVRVALHTQRMSDMPRLLEGLRLLNQADANVRVATLETGETVVAASGEVHLERCLRDLRERFAPDVPFEASKPLVEFRETIVPSPADEAKRELDGDLVTDDEGASSDDEEPAAEAGAAAGEAAGAGAAGDDGDDDDEKDGDAPDAPRRRRPFTFSRRARTPNKTCRFRMRAVPLPASVTALLSARQEELQAAALAAQDTAASAEAAATLAGVREAVREALAAAEADGFSADDADRVWSLGPRRCGANVLLCRVPGLAFTPHWDAALGRSGRAAAAAAAVAAAEAAAAAAESDTPASSEAGGAGSLGRLAESSILGGFQLATAQGPLCAEPMSGVAFVLEDAAVEPWRGEAADPYGPLSGQIISTVRGLCVRAFRARPMRLVEAMYSVELRVTAELLGRLHAVLTQRRARVVSEEMKEGTPYFVVRANLPVAESFGFAQQVRKRTSGVASPQLFFSHWETMEQDPFWRPTTEDELEEFGDAEKGAFPNLVRDLIHAVRVRKGLETERKIVEHAEKQRTLARKK